MLRTLYVAYSIKGGKLRQLFSSVPTTRVVVSLFPRVNISVTLTIQKARMGRRLSKAHLSPPSSSSSSPSLSYYDKVTDITNKPMLKNAKGLRRRNGGIEYSPEEGFTRFRPINDMLKQGVILFFTPEIEVIIRQALRKLSTLPTLDYTWTGASLPTTLALFRVYCDANRGGFGATLE